MRGTILGAAVLAAFAVGSSAQAAQGLNGRYFATLAAFDNVNNQAYADSNTPYATFTANSICYPNCGFGSSVGDGSSLSTFLGVGSGYASNLSADLGFVSGHILALNGFFNAATTGFYGFGLNSDDGSRLRINGLTVVNNDGLHGPTAAYGSVFLSAGTYAIDLLQWENGGGTNLQAIVAGPGATTYAVLGGDYLSTDAGGVPEPAAWALMLTGFGGLGAMLRRRRAVAA
jgi:hypothetical protein